MATTSSKLFATTFGATGRAISSTHVTYNVCAAGLGNSLNLQSVGGNCAVPEMAKIDKLILFFEFEFTCLSTIKVFHIVYKKFLIAVNQILTFN